MLSFQGLAFYYQNLTFKFYSWYYLHVSVVLYIYAFIIMSLFKFRDLEMIAVIKSLLIFRSLEIILFKTYVSFYKFKIRTLLLRKTNLWLNKLRSVPLLILLVPLVYRHINYKKYIYSYDFKKCRILKISVAIYSDIQMYTFTVNVKVILWLHSKQILTLKSLLRKE